MNSENKKFYSNRALRLEKIAVVILVSVILFFHIIPKRFLVKKIEMKAVVVDFTIEAIPTTKQLLRRGSIKPKKPTVPIPIEDLSFPEDATIDEANFEWHWEGSPFGNSGITATKIDTVPPRPVLQVMPEYPEELRKNKINGSIKLLVKIANNGQVKDVIVSDNSTGSELCEKIAIDAAYRSTFIPAKVQNSSIEMWTSCIYSFNPN
jgi:TonB family protein